jgi:hypothetical protein
VRITARCCPIGSRSRPFLRWGTGSKASAHQPALAAARVTNALDAGVPLRDAQILARHADPRTTEHYDRARGSLDRHGIHFLTAYVAGV